MHIFHLSCWLASSIKLFCFLWHQQKHMVDHVWDSMYWWFMKNHNIFCGCYSMKWDSKGKIVKLNGLEIYHQILGRQNCKIKWQQSNTGQSEMQNWNVLNTLPVCRVDSVLASPPTIMKGCVQRGQSARDRQGSMGSKVQAAVLHCMY